MPHRSGDIVSVSSSSIISDRHGARGKIARGPSLTEERTFSCGRGIDLSSWSSRETASSCTMIKRRSSLSVAALDPPGAHSRL